MVQRRTIAGSLSRLTRIRQRYKECAGKAGDESKDGGQFSLAFTASMRCYEPLETARPRAVDLLTADL